MDAKDDECDSCGESDPLNECSKSERQCGHHCNHIWTHNECDWCGLVEQLVVVSISFACNDPDNGNFAGRFPMVAVGDGLLRLETDIFDETSQPTIEFNFNVGREGGFAAADKGTGTVVIAGRSFPIVGYKSWYGNWCWDVAVMEPDTAIEIVNHLKGLGVFTCTEGESRCYETFNSADGIFDRDEWRALFVESGYQQP